MTENGEEGNGGLQGWGFIICCMIWWVGSRDVYLFLSASESLDDASVGPILIYLTDGSYRTILRDLLNVHGYRVVMAESGDGFMDRLHVEPRPVLLLMDFPRLGTEDDDFFAQNILIEQIESIPMLIFTGLSDFIERPAITTLLPDPRGIAYLIKLVETVLS